MEKKEVIVAQGRNKTTSRKARHRRKKLGFKEQKEFETLGKELPQLEKERTELTETDF